MTNSSLLKVDLSFNGIHKEGFETLPVNTTLRILILRQGDIDYDCVELISKAQGLKIVDLSTNLLTAKSGMFLALNSAIEELNLTQT